MLYSLIPVNYICGYTILDDLHSLMFQIVDLVISPTKFD